MDKKSLTSFIVLAEELQFSRAAKRLGLTQSALSQQIARLEKELKIELFERTKRKVRLSEPGHFFLPDALAVISCIDRATETAQRTARGQLGKLDIAYVDAAPFSILSMLILEFRKSSPNVELVLHEMTSSEQFKALQDGKIDIGLLRPLYSADWIHTVTLFKEPYVVAMHKEHELANQNEVHIRALTREKFLFTSKAKAQYFYAKWNLIFSEYGMNPEIIQEVNQLHTLVCLVGAGMGLAFIPLSVAKYNSHNIIYKEITGAEIPYTELNLAWNCDKNSVLVNNFTNIAKTVSQTFNKKP